MAQTRTHLLIDSWYHCRRVRRAAQRRGWQVSGGLSSNRTMRLREADGSQTWCFLSDYAARLESQDWQEAHWPAQDGGQTLSVHAVHIWVRKLGPTLLLITFLDPHAAKPSWRYWGSSCVDAAPQALITALAQRWQIEAFFEDQKDLLGADHYQRLKAEAIVRFWTLGNALLYFLEEQSAQQEVQPTCGEVLRRLRQEHQRNLVIWLGRQFHEGATAERLFTQLTLQAPEVQT